MTPVPDGWSPRLPGGGQNPAYRPAAGKGGASGLLFPARSTGPRVELQYPRPHGLFDFFLSLPRVEGLALSPDGTRLVTSVATVAPDGKKFLGALWELDPRGEAPPRRLTRSAKGEGSPVFLPDGSLLFTSSRPDPEVTGDDGDDDPPAALWLLPAGGGEARLVAKPPGGVEGVAVARGSGRVAVAVAVFPDAEDLEQDGERFKARRKAGVKAQLFEHYPIRSWDHYLGPRRRRIFVADAPAGGGRLGPLRQVADGGDGGLLDLLGFDLTPDGRTLLVHTRRSADALHPHSLVWSADSRRVWFVADQQGRAPLFSVTVGRGRITRHAADAGYATPRPAPGGRAVFALRAGIDRPPEAVRLATAGAGGEPTPVPTPGIPLRVPGRVRELVATAADGTPIRSWLVLPKGATGTRPAPLVAWFHGGPLGSWNSWSWRWNPWLLAGRGYAVLLPDPAISTGYGRDFIQRGYGRWGREPFTDLMAAVDAACARRDVDETRTAAMGGSFGGYMANWVAGHTDRFRCIVTHASLWALDQFHGTTDVGVWWEQEFGDPYADPARYLENSPHRHVGRIRTPMLVIHGEQDHRVLVGEALRLWTDLVRHGVDAKFLYFPDENHWILKPQHARVWYETVFAWLDHHVLGKEWVRPALL